MDTVELIVFLAVTLLFAFLLTWLLKFTLFRYIPWAMQLPWWGWMIIIVLAAFALEGMGVPVSAGYAAFFDWLSRILAGGGAI